MLVARANASWENRSLGCVSNHRAILALFGANTLRGRPGRLKALGFPSTCTRSPGVSRCPLPERSNHPMPASWQTCPPAAPMWGTSTSGTKPPTSFLNPWTAAATLAASAWFRYFTPYRVWSILKTTSARPSPFAGPRLLDLNSFWRGKPHELRQPFPRCVQGQCVFVAAHEKRNNECSPPSQLC